MFKIFSYLLLFLQMSKSTSSRTAGIASSHTDIMKHGLAFITRSFLSMASKKVCGKIYEIFFCIESKLSASSSAAAAMSGANPRKEIQS